MHRVYRWGLAEIGVVSFFLSDGGGGAVSGVYNGFVGQGKEFDLDAVDECVVIASPEVCATDASFKEHVAREEATGFTFVKDEASGRVSGYMSALQGVVSEGNDVAVFQVGAEGNGGFADADAEPGGLLEEGGHFCFFEGVSLGCQVEDSRRIGVAKGVVEVQVGVEEVFHLKVVLFYETCQFRLLKGVEAAAIDDGGFEGIVVQDECIDGYDVEYKCFYFHHDRGR